MKIYSFVKRLNATELGLGVTHDAYIAIPIEVDLSTMLENQRVLQPFNRYSNELYTPRGAKFKYVQTGQNRQERISGLGEFYSKTNAKIGDEILIEKIENDNTEHYFIDLHHRNAIVFQVNTIQGQRYVEILPNDIIYKYANEDGYTFQVIYKGHTHQLNVVFKHEIKKKKNSPTPTKFYDMLIDNVSILSHYNYQEYIELLTTDMRLGLMKTYWYSILDFKEDKNE